MSSSNIINLQQSLLEHMSDWLDKDHTKIDVIFADMENQTPDSNIHIEMAKAAFNVFVKSQYLCEIQWML